LSTARDFHQAFGAVAPTGKATLLALDVSGSMGALMAGAGTLDCRTAAAAMALVTAAREPNHHFVAFTGNGGGGYYNSRPAALTPLAIHGGMRLRETVRTMTGVPFGPTDCALPMLWAIKEKVNIDTFVVYTDSETYHGAVHPFQALRDYRQASGRAAKLVVVGMTSTGFTIADPNDAGMLDVVGFDAAAPALIADFAREEVVSTPA
jgi:60 kDa SS-A/Ro ribonucleoprotein